ncbi:MAG: hypothetical protein KKE44_19530 [Proteobacteria bacterium]|nr:hypothetical protein [Pseudomonadota bacterium]MBU1584926.1 hypothetical protein [Pseudomonadota bacterium]
MAHEYSVQIHDWISEKISKVKQKIKLAKEKNDVKNKNYYKGQLQELLDIRQYLKDQIDLETYQYHQ